MRNMKNQKSNLKFKHTFFLIGINIALGSILALFNWTMVQGKANLEDPKEVGTYFPPDYRFKEEPTNDNKKVVTSKRTDTYKISDNLDDTPKDDPDLTTNKKGISNLDSFLKYNQDDGGPIKMADVEDKTIYKGLDAEFIGGSFQSFVQNQINIPGIAKEVGLVGNVTVEFVVEKDGSISNLLIVTPKERWMGYGAEQACVNVVKLSSGKWRPAKVNNKPVRTLFRLPIEIDYSTW